MPGLGEHLGDNLPETEGSVADGEDGGVNAPALAIAQKVGPGVGRFAVAVGHGDQLLGAVGALAHEHQDLGLDLDQTYAQMDAVRPDIHVVGYRQVALAERLVVGLSLLREPGDRGEGRYEIPAEQAVEVEQREHLAYLRRLAAPRRHDRRGEPPALACLRIDTLVVNPRGPDLNRPVCVARSRDNRNIDRIVQSFWFAASQRVADRLLGSSRMRVTSRLSIGPVGPSALDRIHARHGFQLT